MPLPSQDTSVFDHVHDVVVFGAGFAGLGALTSLVRGRRRVLLVDRLGDVAWECGRAMCTEVGQADHPVWKRWTQRLHAHQAMVGRQVLPAAAEALATEALANTPQVKLLYYVAPVAVEMQGDCLATVTVATRSGLARIAGRQFIDATEQGELLSLLPARCIKRQPRHLRTRLFFQKVKWPDDHVHTIKGLTGSRCWLAPSCWELERCLHLELPGGESKPRNHLLPALEAVHAQLGDFMHQAVLTHSSSMPLPVYDELADEGQTPTTDTLPANVLSASPAMAKAGSYDTLAARFELGIVTGEHLSNARRARHGEYWRDQPLASIQPREYLQADVAVAGLGTGGLMAAVAAGRQGKRVIAFDAMPFSGGVGSGAGIHVYYHGVRGGLQDELDQRIRQIMPLFGQPGQVQGYHPDARKIVADQMLHEAGVCIVQGVLAGVQARDGKVRSAIVCTNQGPVQLNAAAWIDSTGDGELAAKAGATFNAGRQADGQFHAFSQSSGRASVQDGMMRMFCLNFDAGHVDPTDSCDLTRARVLGVRHYVQSRYRQDDHPTMIAPMMGIRHGRHIHTDYTLTLCDLIAQRQFEDVIAYARCHYDNHAVDYELESDEAMFWVWVCRQWHQSLQCDVPYRCLLPRGLDNLWLACRALGVSQDAQFVLRMQRDMQRIGEVAGLAAAIACQDNCSNRQVDLHLLTAQLRASGALRAREPSSVADLPACHMDEQSPAGLWSMYQAGPSRASDAVLKLLASAEADVSWHGAAVAAMWGMTQAQPRLCHAIATREDGQEHASHLQNHGLALTQVPCWVSSVALLRICGDEECLTTLETLARDESLVANVRTSIALTLQRIAVRGRLSSRGRDMAVQILHRLLASDVPMKAAPPRRPVMEQQHKPEPDHGYWRPMVSEDFHWQMQWAIASALVALDQPVQESFQQLGHDSRAIVRRAAKALSAGRPANSRDARPAQTDSTWKAMTASSLQGVS